MIHQPSGGAKGQATEIQIVAENILKTKKKLNEILAANTGQTVEKIAEDTERDNFMSAEEAKAYGLIDEIVESRNAAKEERINNVKWCRSKRGAIFCHIRWMEAVKRWQERITIPICQWFTAPFVERQRSRFTS